MQNPCQRIGKSGEKFRGQAQAKRQRKVNINSQRIPKRCLSSRCTGKMQYTFFRSTLISCVHRPNSRMKSTASSTDGEQREQRSDGIKSSTLRPLGWERSMIILHASPRWPLGTKPIGLVWMNAKCWTGPSIRPADCSEERYVPTAEGLTRHDG